MAIFLFEGLKSYDGYGITNYGNDSIGLRSFWRPIKSQTTLGLVAVVSKNSALLFSFLRLISRRTDFENPPLFYSLCGSSTVNWRSMSDFYLDKHSKNRLIYGPPHSFPLYLSHHYSLNLANLNYLTGFKHSIAFKGTFTSFHLREPFPANDSGIF